MKKIAILLSVVMSITVLILLAGTAVSAAELVISFSGEELNNGEEVGGDTGGASYVDAEGGYRTMIHGVNTGVRPIKNFFADIFSPDGQDIVIRYKVKILADDGTTADDTRVFGFYQIIMGDGTAINREDGDALFFTAGEIRAMEKDENGWFYVYYVVENERFSLTEYDMIEINNQVYYNGAKDSGCAIDIAVAEIAVYAGDPRVSGELPDSSDSSSSDTAAPSETTPAQPDTSDTPGSTGESPATTDPADSSSSASDKGKRAEESNLSLYISGAAVLFVAAGCAVYLILLKRKYTAGSDDKTTKGD